jgi:hypothetical protein
MPFKSKAQARFMFAAESHGELPKGTAKRWAKHTPDIKKLPEKVSDTSKTAAYKYASIFGYYDVLLKLAALDPSLYENVKRVAAKMKIPAPSMEDAERIFPKGWEKANPSWQEQFLGSDWFKAENSKRQFGGGASKSWRGGNTWDAGSRSRPSWAGAIPQTGRASRAAQAYMRFPFLGHWVASSILAGIGGGMEAGLQSRMTKNNPEMAPEEVSAVTSPVRKGRVAGGVLGAGLGAAVPIIANWHLRKPLGGLKALARHPGIGLSALLTGSTGAMYGQAAGGLAGMPFAYAKGRKASRLLDESVQQDEEYAPYSKAASDDKPEIPSSPRGYLPKSLAWRSALGGAVMGGASPFLNSAAEYVTKNPAAARNLKDMLHHVSKNRPDMPALLGRHIIGGAAGGAIAGALTGLYVQRLLVKRKAKADNMSKSAGYWQNIVDFTEAG